MPRANSSENTLMLGKIEGRGIRGKIERIRWLDTITESMNMSLSKLWEIAKGEETGRPAVHGVVSSRSQLKRLNNNPCVK